MSENKVVMSDVAAEDMRSALAILESIHFLVGPELLRRDITKAIQHIKHGLATGEACSQDISLKGEKEFEEGLTPKRYLIRTIGTKDYYGAFAPCGTTKENATSMCKAEAEYFVKRSTARNGKSKLEIVEEGEPT